MVTVCVSQCIGVPIDDRIDGTLRLMTRPPIAARRTHRYTRHGVTVEDPYAWLKDPNYPDVSDPDILAYLNAENAYFDSVMAPYQPLVQSLFEELKEREPQEDSGVPYRRGAWWYQWRFEHGAQYRTWLRAPRATTGADADTAPAPDDPGWQVFLDEPSLAEEHNYFVLGGMDLTPDGRYLAWSADTNGSERFTLRITDLETGEILDEPIADTLGSPVWAEDGQHLLYVVVNDRWRPYQVRLHTLSTAGGDDPVLYEEADESFFVSVDKTSSDQFLLIAAGDHVTSEVRYLPAHDPTTPPVLMAPRRAGHEYSVDHGEGRFYILSNRAHKNFELASAGDGDPREAAWETLIEGADDRYLTWFSRFAGRLVVGERIEGLDQVRIIEDGGADYLVTFPEPTHTVSLGVNAEYRQDTLRLHYESLVTPATVFDFRFADRSLETRKTQRIPSGYDAGLYVSERLTAVVRDGTRVPVSLVHRRDLQPGPDTPLYLYGYGAYGMAIPPGFSAHRLSLLDRGFVFAIAHIRGGDDLGYAWYEDGKLDKRTNTFHDFVDVASFLVARGYTGQGRIAIAGGSAGGELMGAAVNLAPELWGAVVAHVPFMDVLNTMQDTTLPLTPIEWPEWGNPIEDPEAFACIQSYSPYDQLREGHYPPMLVTAGLNDPRVTYWEPAKYVAKLRTCKKDGNWLLLKTNMDAGHRGQSGRFEALQELAEEYAFILASMGLAKD